MIRQTVWTPQLTHDQVAKIMTWKGTPISRQRVAQLERKAMMKMRLELAGWSDNPQEKELAEAAVVAMKRGWCEAKKRQKERKRLSEQ